MGSSKFILLFLILISGNFAKKQKKVNTEETFLLLDSMQVKLADRILTQDDRKNDIKTDYNPDESDSSPSLPEYLHKNSTCPWKYVKVVNKKRIPDTIIEAECVSSQCRLPGNAAVGGDYRKQLKTSPIPISECQPIMYFRWVKVRKEKRSKKNTYFNRLLPITVGCTCAYTNIQRLQP